MIISPSCICRRNDLIGGGTCWESQGIEGLAVFSFKFPNAFGQFLLLGALSAIVALTVAACA